jgi:hypothetical protein
VPRLPLHYRRSWSQRAADYLGTTDPEGAWWDQDRALAEIEAVRAALDDVYADLEAASPEGVRARRRRQATLDDLMVAIRATPEYG